MGYFLDLPHFLPMSFLGIGIDFLELVGAAFFVVINLLYLITNPAMRRPVVDMDG